MATYTGNAVNPPVVDPPVVLHSSTYTIFCIGSGHNDSEINNTFAYLANACESFCQVVIGPGGGKKSIKETWDGWTGKSLNDKFSEVMIQLRREERPITRINLTGHSRGAILCHMIAWAIAGDRILRRIPVCMFLLDPVHQSKYEHIGGEDLHHDLNLQSYIAIIMEHENQGLGPRSPNFPFKMIRTSNEAHLRSMRYIRMPGSHGSGSQNMTNPVGVATKHLIANYLIRRGTLFDHTKIHLQSDIEMCEHFAAMHKNNIWRHFIGLMPKESDRDKYLTYDDGGDSHVHVKKKSLLKSTETLRPPTWRQKALEETDKHNNTYLGEGLTNWRPRGIRYFFNDQHAFHFSQAFPYMYNLLMRRTPAVINRLRYKIEKQKMMGYVYLDQAFPLIEMELEEMQE
jgi:hypothetical protein